MNMSPNQKIERNDETGEKQKEDKKALYPEQTDL